MAEKIKLTWTGYQSIGRSDVIAEYAPKRKNDSCCKYRTLIIRGRGGYYIQVLSERFKAWGQAGPDVFTRDGVYQTQQEAMQAVEDYMNENEHSLISEWEDSIANSKWIITEIYLRRWGREHTLNEECVVPTRQEAKAIVRRMEIENDYPKNPKYASLPGNTYIRAKAFNSVTREHIYYNFNETVGPCSLESHGFWYARG